jgi:hypothetical protein
MTKSLRLTEAAVEQYRREGFLLFPEELFPAGKFQRLKNHFEQLLAALPAVVIGMAMGMSHTARIVFSPLIYALYPVPKIKDTPSPTGELGLLLKPLEPINHVSWTLISARGCEPPTLLPEAPVSGF